MIPDEMIDRYLHGLFGNSEPGATVHHLLLVAGKAGPLGLPQADKLDASIYALVPDDSVDAEQFITKTIVAAVHTTRQRGEVIHLAVLATEDYFVPHGRNEVTENLARRLVADRRLGEHPAAVEVTRLYAACGDGRRWVGQHYLTGPHAGTVSGPTVRIGELAEQEVGIWPRLIRAAVGLRIDREG